MEQIAGVRKYNTVYISRKVNLKKENRVYICVCLCVSVYVSLPASIYHSNPFPLCNSKIYYFAENHIGENNWGYFLVKLELTLPDDFTPFHSAR